MAVYKYAEGHSKIKPKKLIIITMDLREYQKMQVRIHTSNAYNGGVNAGIPSNKS